MKAIGFAGLVALLLATSVMGSTVTWNARAEAMDYNGNPIDLSQPIDPAALPPIDDGMGGTMPNGVYLIWTVSCVVTGDNQGLGGAVVSMGVKNVATDAWAPVVQDAGGLSHPAIYKAPGTGANGSVADDASAGGVGAGKGASVGSADPAQLYVAQMGMGYLNWSARRYKISPLPKAWVGAQQWGVGLDSRKTNILAAGVDGLYDLVTGSIDITTLPVGTYKSTFPLEVMTSSVINSGINLNSDQEALDMTAMAVGSVDNALLAGDFFEFTIVPEPATLLLLAGAGLLYRRRSA